MLKFFVQSFSKDHVLSHSTENCTADLAHPLMKGEALLGDLVIVHHGPYVGWGGSIEWINPDGFWVYFNDGVGSDEANEDSMTLVEPCHVHIKPAPNTLTLTRDKGYNVTVGDIMEVARGNYYHCEGVVKAMSRTKYVWYRGHRDHVSCIPKTEELFQECFYWLKAPGVEEEEDCGYHPTRRLLRI